MGELIQMTIISTTVVRIPQKKWNCSHSQQKSLKSLRGYNLNNERMISVYFQAKPFNITVIQVYGSTANAEEDECEWFCEDI